MSAIEAAGLTKSYGGTKVLNGVDLKVPAGEVLALLGPNGAGKTTTVRILATLIDADAGTARVAGFDVREAPSQVRKRLSLTGQYAAVDDLQTGLENLVMIGRLRGLPARAARVRAGELLEEFDLSAAAGRRVGTYSGGMRRRLDLAASLITRPEVLFLDEPTTGLDPRSRQGVWRVVADLARSGVTVLLTTQYLEEADSLADNIVVLDGGRIIAEGTASALKARVGEQRLDLGAANFGAYETLRESLGTRVTQADPEALVLSVGSDGSAGHVRAVLDEIDPGRQLLARFDVHRASLDDVFLALTGTTTSTPTVASAPEGEPIHA
jgi:ABC-2 type transport system ATP-binding protein